MMILLVVKLVVTASAVAGRLKPLLQAIRLRRY